MVVFDVTNMTGIHVGNICIEHIISMISSIYIEIYGLFTMYYWNEVDEKFDELLEELEQSIYKSVDEVEQYKENVVKDVMKNCLRHLKTKLFVW